MAATRYPRAIIALDDFKESDNIMVYADTGTGKTELVGHLEGKVLILMAENGIRVVKRGLARMGLDWNKEKHRFKVWRIRSWADLEEAYVWLRDNQTAFDWVVIDSATKIQERSMRAAMEVAYKRNPEKRDIDLPDRGEHQKMQNAMKRMVTDFVELDCNTLWFAQAMRRETPDGDEIVLPFIMGKDYEVSAFCCAQMMAFGYYTKKASKKVKGQTDRVLIWESYADNNRNVEYWSKDRYDVFPKVCVMAEGDTQKMNFRDLMRMVTDEARKTASKRVSERDDSADLDAEEEVSPPPRRTVNRRRPPVRKPAK